MAWWLAAFGVLSACTPEPHGWWPRVRAVEAPAPDAPVTDAPGTPDDDTGPRPDTGEEPPADTGGPAEAPPASEKRQDLLGLCDAWDTDHLETLADLQAADGDVAVATDLGLGLVRAHRPLGHAFSWNVVQPPNSEPDWTLPDHVVLGAQRGGVRLMATLYPYTDTTFDADASMPGFDVPDESLDAWLEFVDAIVERYDADGHDDMPGLEQPVFAWELGNEPSCGDDLCAERFFKVASASYVVAKAAAPEALVVVAGAAPVFDPGTGETVDRTTRVYDYWFDHGGAAFTDAFTFHTTVGGATPPVATYVSYWRGRAGGLPLWITEFGTRSMNDTLRVSHDEEVEAAWLVDFLDHAYGSGIERVAWCKAGDDANRYPLVADALRDYSTRFAP